MSNNDTYAVKSAVYGAQTPSGRGAIDVTKKLQTYLDDGMVQLRISNQLFSDPALHVPKAFAAVVTINGTDYTFACVEGTTLDFSAPELPANTYIVKSALYGARTASGGVVDVTSVLQTYLNDGVVKLFISTERFPDPAPHVPKAFAAVVTINGTDHTFACVEHTTLDFSAPEPPANTYVVKSAVYGAASGGVVDVTSVLQTYLNDGMVKLIISTKLFPDPAPHVPKAFAAVVTINGTDHTFVCVDGATLDFSAPEPPANTYVVKSAVYGAPTKSGGVVDVTSVLQTYLNGGMVQLRIGNQLFSDPAPNVPKAFGAIVTVNGIDYAYACVEGSTLDFSPPQDIPAAPPTYSWQTLALPANGTVGAMYVDHAGNVYVCAMPSTGLGSSAGYLAMWSPENRTWKNLGGSLTSKFFFQMCADSSRNIYVGGQKNAAGNAALGIYNALSGVWTAADTGVQGTIVFVDCDSRDNIYVAGSLADASGLFVLIYDPASSRWTNVDCSGLNPWVLGGMCVDANGQMYLLYADRDDVQQLAYHAAGSWKTISSPDLRSAAGIGCDNAGNVYFNTANSVMSCAVATSTFTDLQANLPATSIAYTFSAMLVDGILYVAMFGETSAGARICILFAYRGGIWRDLTPPSLNTNNTVALYGPAGNSSQSIFLALASNQGVFTGSLAG